MEYLGVVETVTNDGKAVVRAVATPEVNDAVFDNREHRIGTVKRIFGPVDSPYVTIVPNAKENAGSLLNKKAFFKGDIRNGKAKGRRGRN